MDSVAVTALVLSVISGLGHFVKEVNLQHCNCFCVDSDCAEKKIEKEIINSENKIYQHTLKIQKLKQKRKSNSNISNTPPLTPISENEA
jgi:hypothetical protein